MVEVSQVLLLQPVHKVGQGRALCVTANKQQNWGGRGETSLVIQW